MQKIGQNFNKMGKNKNFISSQHCIRQCFSLPRFHFVLLLSLQTSWGIVLNFVLNEDEKYSWKKNKTLNAFFSKLDFLTFKLWNAVSRPFFEVDRWMRSHWKWNFLLYTLLVLTPNRQSAPFSHACTHI